MWVGLDAGSECLDPACCEEDTYVACELPRTLTVVILAITGRNTPHPAWYTHAPRPLSPCSTLNTPHPRPILPNTPGAIAGVQHTAGGPSAGSATVAETVLAALEEAVAGPHDHSHAHGQPYGGVRLLEQRFLAAAAFLARESAEEAEEAASGACHRLLQALCTAPLKRWGSLIFAD